MSDPAAILTDLRPQKKFFVGIDSDGCVFDTMEIKQKECFCPNFVYHFGLQAVSKYAREAWEFVNLYSKDRGCNRFIAVIKALDLLRRRPEVKARGVAIPELAPLRDWMKRETKLGNPALKEELARNPSPELSTVYDYSVDANATVERIVRGVPPFPLVRESLERLSQEADVMVVSQTPTEALVREWKEHGVDRWVRVIAGQELGTKSEHLKYAAAGKYPGDRILMIGDAPGDLKAARDNGVLFFPVNPGHEERSWELFHREALDRFLSGRYAGDYEERLIREFNAYLPERAPWESA